jgi:hypothetical protein
MNMSRTYTDSFSKDWTTGFKAIQDIGTGFPGTGIVANDNVGNSVNISILDGSAYSIDSGVFNIQAQDATGNNNTFVGYAQGGQWSIQNTTGASSSIGMAANTINLLVNDGTPNIDYGFDIAGGYVKWRYGDNYYRLPSSLPSVGQVLGVSAIFGNTTQLDWITVSGGGSGSPAGSNGQVQYNNAGSLGGVGEFVGVWGSGVAVGVYVGVTVGVTVPVGSVAVMMTESDVPQSLQFPGPWTKNGLPVHA